MKIEKTYLFVLLAIYNLCQLSAQQGESEFKTIKINQKDEEIVELENIGDQPENEGYYAIDIVCDIDKNIPKCDQKYQNRYAVIIGNEDYHSFQTKLSDEVDVEFAARDAFLFRQYAIKTLGIPEENILFKINAGQIEMKRMFEQINRIIKYSDGQSEVFVYYAGHGFPDINTRIPYIIPVDVTANDLEYALKLEDLYKLLTEHSSKRVTVFLDACFSGGGRNLGLLAARAVKIKPREETIHGNLVVFTASSATQPALPYDDKEHGLFTYYLLKKLQETNGEVSYVELSDYLSSKVPIKSIIMNNLEQTPKVNISPTLGESWEVWSFR